MTGQKILVTGANGFIGTVLVHSLVQQGNTVRCLVRKTSVLTSLQGLDLEYVYGDLDDQEALAQAVTGVDYIFHLAGLVKAINLPTFLKTNAGGVKHILDAVQRNNPKLKRFLLVSSIASGRPALSLHDPILEQDATAPVSLYGRSKREGELRASHFMDIIPITIVRPVSVYGPGDKEFFRYFKLIERFRIKPVFGKGDQSMNMIHVDDLVEGLILAGESPHSVGQTYYLSGEGVYDWIGITTMIEKAINKKAVTLHLPCFLARFSGWCNDIKMRLTHKPEFFSSTKIREGLEYFWICSNQKAKQELDFYPSISVQTGIKNTYEWYKKNKWL